MAPLINFLIGYIIFINIIGFGLIVLITRQEGNKKLNLKKVNTFIIVIALLGGFIGLMVSGEMTGYKDDNIVLKRYVPLLVFCLVAICIIIVFIKIGGFSSVEIPKS